MESTFASYIKSYLHSKYRNDADQLFQLSYILQYLVHKTIFTFTRLVVPTMPTMVV